MTERKAHDAAGRPPDAVTAVRDCELRVIEHRWVMTEEHATEIAAFWERQRALNPGYFDGVVFIARDIRIAGGVLYGELFASRFRNFLYWRDTGFADTSVTDAFGSAILRSSDGGVLLARQRGGNVNAGQVYLPGGFIDERDIAARGSVDILGSIEREIGEETGLDAAAMSRDDGYTVTRAGPHVSISATFRTGLDATTLANRVGAHLGRDPEAELESVRVVRSLGELSGFPLVRYCETLLPVLLG